MGREEFRNPKRHRDVMGLIEWCAVRVELLWKVECLTGLRGQATHEDFNGVIWSQRLWSDDRLIDCTVSFSAVHVCSAKVANNGRWGVWNTIRGGGYIKQPVVAVHFTNSVRSTVGKYFVEIFDFVLPFAVGALLPFWKEKRLARVETAVNSGQRGLLARDFENAWKTQ